MDRQRRDSNFPGIIFALTGIFLFLAAPRSGADTVELPSQDVTANRPATNEAPGNSGRGFILPEGIFGDEGAGGIVIFNDDRKRASELGTGDKKNALFVIEYGLYDYLNSALTFANQFGPVSYLFSFYRESEEDFHADRRRIYNSQNSLDNFDLNLQAISKSAGNVARFQYLKDETGLQGNTNYFLQNKKLMLANDLFTLRFGPRTRFEFTLGYDYVEDSVKNSTSAVLAVYQKVSGQAKFSAMFSDVNSYHALLRIDYENLSRATNTAGDLLASFEVYDNFMLWNLVGFELKAGGLYSIRDGFAFLPSAEFSYAVSETMRIKAYSSVKDSGLFFTDFVRRYDYLYPPSLIPPRTYDWGTGARLETLFFKGSSLSLDCHYSSERGRYFLKSDPVSPRLFAIGGRDIDSIKAEAALSMKPVKFFTFNMDYKFAFFERPLDYYPRHDLTASADLKLLGFDLVASLRYFSGVTISGKTQSDIVNLDLGLKREISRNMTVSLRTVNVLDRVNRFYKGYTEQGFLLVAGFKVNLY